MAADAQVEIRPCTAADQADALAVHEAAFPTDGEARLVALLTSRGKSRVSLVAESGGRIVGHVLFSPVQVRGAASTSHGLGLAPLAVLPEFQRRDIGTKLVEAGLAACRQLGQPFVVVLGEPEYYGRFGFRRASLHGLANEYNADEAFQVFELKAGGLHDVRGLVQYAPEFAEILG